MSASALRRARLLRGLTVSMTGAMLGIGGHLLAGGPVPAAPAVLLLVVMAAAACTLASDRQWSFLRLLVALGGVQLVVHGAMGLQMGPRMDGQASAQLVATGGPSWQAAGPSGWVMVGAHALAAVVTAWLLRQGEALLWRLVERLRPRPLWPTVSTPLDLTRAAAASPAYFAARRLHPLTGSLARRGPPSLTTA
jgi:hypothetical protein